MSSKSTTPQSNGQKWKLKKWDWMRLLWSSPKTDKSGTDGEKLEAPTVKGSDLSNIVRSIDKLMLNDFITCVVDGDLTVLGEGTAEQLEAAWFSLLSDYYELRKDKRSLRFAKLICDIQIIEDSNKRIKLLVDCLNQGYNEQLAACLRIDYPMFQLTEDSCKTELKYVQNAEKNSELKLISLKNELSELQKDSEKTTGKKAKRSDFIEYLLEINKHEGHGYSENTMSVEKFAICLNRLESHIELLRRQSARKK